MNNATFVRSTLIGAGLLNREVATAFGRWFALAGDAGRHELSAVCDASTTALEWFQQVLTVRRFNADRRVTVARTEAYGQMLETRYAIPHSSDLAHTRIVGRPAPRVRAMRRPNPAEITTRPFAILGTGRGLHYPTYEPKTSRLFRRDKGQGGKRTDLGLTMAFETGAGGIFGLGILEKSQRTQATVLAERAGWMKRHFGCAAPDGVVTSQEIWAAGLASGRQQQIIAIS